MCHRLLEVDVNAHDENVIGTDKECEIASRRLLEDRQDFRQAARS